MFVRFITTVLALITATPAMATVPAPPSGGSCLEALVDGPRAVIECMADGVLRNDARSLANGERITFLEIDLDAAWTAIEEMTLSLSRTQVDVWDLQERVDDLEAGARSHWLTWALERLDVDARVTSGDVVMACGFHVESTAPHSLESTEFQFELVCEEGSMVFSDMVLYDCESGGIYAESDVAECNGTIDFESGVPLTVKLGPGRTMCLDLVPTVEEGFDEVPFHVSFNPLTGSKFHAGLYELGRGDHLPELKIEGPIFIVD